MPLDFVSLGQGGAPEKNVPLGVDVHHELLVAVAGRGFPFFRSFEDYYEDVEVMVKELPLLREQARALRAQALSPALHLFLDGLISVVEQAMADGRSIHVIAD